MNIKTLEVTLRYTTELVVRTFRLDVTHPVVVLTV